MLARLGDLINADLVAGADERALVHNSAARPSGQHTQPGSGII
jgi:hypothetical protein